MRNRCLLALASLACTLVVLVVCCWPTPPAPPPGVTIENFRRLRHEMTEAQAIAIFGRPCDVKEHWSPGSSVSYWYSPAVTFAIHIDDTSERLTGGATIWMNLDRHEPEFLGETSWTSWWHRLWHGRQRVLD
jgi:hypothetical protein